MNIEKEAYVRNCALVCLIILVLVGSKPALADDVEDWVKIHLDPKSYNVWPGYTAPVSQNVANQMEECFELIQLETMTECLRDVVITEKEKYKMKVNAKPRHIGISVTFNQLFDI